MSTATDHDGDQRFALGLLFAIIALVVVFVLFLGASGGAMFRGSAPAAATAGASGTAAALAAVPSVAVVTETVSVAIADAASVRVTDGIVNFYFATGSADLAPGAAEALASVIQGVQAGRRAVISGFHDTTGDAAANEALAARRAGMVREVLVGLGVPAARLDLQKPALTAGTGIDAQARRVEVKLVD
ncbi:MAG: OmpA family protein [Comamonadaceae bacterium]|nr:MAG: OmpA family protein [Comamonadaceae bacterium]